MPRASQQIFSATGRSLKDACLTRLVITAPDFVAGSRVLLTLASPGPLLIPTGSAFAPNLRLPRLEAWSIQVSLSAR